MTNAPSEQRSRWRRFLLLVALVGLSAGAVVAVRGASNVTTDTAMGSSPSAMYHEALSQGYTLESHVTWLPTDPNVVRVPTEEILNRVAHDWAAIWFTLDGIHSDAAVANPDETLVGAALRRALEHQPALSDQTVRQLEHELRVNFYSLDGAVIGLTVERAVAVHTFADSVSGYPLTLQRTTRYKAVIELIDGRWRLSQLQSEE